MKRSSLIYLARHLAASSGAVQPSQGRVMETQPDICSSRRWQTAERSAGNIIFAENSSQELFTPEISLLSASKLSLVLWSEIFSQRPWKELLCHKDRFSHTASSGLPDSQWRERDTSGVWFIPAISAIYLPARWIMPQKSLCVWLAEAGVYISHNLMFIPSTIWPLPKTKNGI